MWGEYDLITMANDMPNCCSAFIADFTYTFSFVLSKDWAHTQIEIKVLPFRADHHCSNTYPLQYGHILTNCGRDKFATILQGAFPDAFCFMKRAVYWFKYHKGLFARIWLKISHHRFTKWLRAVSEQTISWTNCPNIAVAKWCPKRVNAIYCA